MRDMQMIYSSMMLLRTMMYFLIPLPLVVYVVIRWKSEKDKLTRDPMLGIKVVLHYFRSLALLLLLSGLTYLVYDLLENGGGTGSEAAAGVFVSSLIIFICISLLIDRKTNCSSFPLVRNFFSGFSLVVTGIASMLGFVLLFLGLFRGANFTRPLVLFLVADCAALILSNRFLHFSFLRWLPGCRKKG